MKAPVPNLEEKRLEALRRYQIVDAMVEAGVEELTRLTAKICETPIAMVSLVDEDRQIFKSRVGMEIEGTHRDYSFCAHAVLSPECLFVIEDATMDDRFVDNPLVTGGPHIRFYAGMPLTTPEGYALGTLCVLDQKPRTLTPLQNQALRTLSMQVMMQFELRRHVLDSQEAEKRERLQKIKIQNILESIAEAFFVVDAVWRFTFANAVFEKIMGRSQKVLNGLFFWEEFPEMLHSRFEAEFRRALQTAEPASFEEYYAPLSLWLEVHLFPGADGLSVLLRDTSERRLAEQVVEDYLTLLDDENIELRSENERLQRDSGQDGARDGARDGAQDGAIDKVPDAPCL